MNATRKQFCANQARYTRTYEQKTTFRVGSQYCMCAKLKYSLGLHYRRYNSCAFKIDLEFQMRLSCIQGRFILPRVHETTIRPCSHRRECNKTTFSWSCKITHTQNEFQAEFTLQHVHISTFRLCSHCVRLLRINQLSQEQYSSIFMEFEQHQRWK